jgi:hypothetical protein
MQFVIAELVVCLLATQAAHVQSLLPSLFFILFFLFSTMSTMALETTLFVFFS